MKKTLIALMALAGIVAGATVEITPLTETEGWTHDTLGNTRWTLTDSVLSYSPAASSGAAVSTYTLETKLGGDVETPLTFKFDITRSDKDVGVSVTFVGQSTAVVIGTKGYTSGYLYSAQTNEVTASGYYFEGGDWKSAGLATPQANALLDSALNYNGTASISGVTSLDDEGNTILTLSVTSTKTSNTGSATYNLGKGFALEKIVFGADNSGTGSDVWKISNFNVTGLSVPEPTTATLSLLALAGLAARRRRK